MKIPTIISAKAINDHTLVLEFSNHQFRVYDISRLLEDPMFKLLQNPGFFRSFRIDLGGYGLVWNEEVDISEYELWRNGVICSESVAREWLDPAIDKHLLNG